MTEAINYGISGSNVNAQNIAVGPNARIDNAAGLPAAFSAQMADLQDAIAGYEGDEETRAQLAAASAEIAGELASPEPDKEGLLEKLSAIGSASVSIGAITTAATALSGLVAAVL